MMQVSRWRWQQFLTIVACCVWTQLSTADEPRISVQQLREDLRTIESTIHDVHPDYRHSVDEAALDSKLAEIAREIDEPLGRDAAWQLFSTLNPLFADGHFLVGFPDWRGDAAAYLRAGGVLFPFEVSVAADGTVMVVAALGGADSPHAGRQLRSIDGRDTRSISERLLARVHGDTPAFRRALLSRRWWFYYWKTFGAAEHFDLVFDGGPPRRVREPGRNAIPAMLLDEAQFARLFSLELLPCETALLTLRSFDWPKKEEFLEFTQRSFEQIRDARVSTLIIDVRENGGGNDELWKEGLLRYLATKPYRPGSSYRKRIMELYRDEGETLGDVVTGKLEGTIPPEPGNPLHYRGRTYALIGAGTYSSAVLFANVMRDFGFGTLAGSGGSARADQSGSVQRIELPHSKLVMFAPRFILARPSGKQHPEMLQPSIALAEDSLDPRAAVEQLLQRLRTPNGQCATRQSRS